MELPPPRMPDRLAKALDALVAASSPAAGAAAPSPEPALPSSSVGAAHPPARPWDRGDLVRRLHTFRASTWFAKPPAAGPIPCARRGWVNDGVDALTCEVRRDRRGGRKNCALDGAPQPCAFFYYIHHPSVLPPQAPLPAAA